MGSLKVHSITSPVVPEPESQSEHHHHHSSGRRVVVTDVQIPFPSLVWFLVKCAVAALPALLILGLLVTAASYLLDVRGFFFPLK